MTIEDFFRGDLAILYIKFQNEFRPVACLTSNSLSESVESLDTTTTDNAGWVTAVPTNQSYQISFSGVATRDLAPNNNKISLYTLRSIKRARTIFDWEIRTNNGEFVDYGKGFLSDISDTAGVNELVQLSGTIIGFGRLFQAGGQIQNVSWDSTVVTWDSTVVTFDQT